MSKLAEALDIIERLGLPKAQQNERSALVLLALAGIKEGDDWRRAGQAMLRTVDIMTFMEEHYGKSYAPNSRETIRRSTIHQFEQARILDRNRDAPDRPTNSRLTVYSLTNAVVPVLKAYRRRSFKTKLNQFLEEQGALQELYAKRRESNKVTLQLPQGAIVALSPGEHNKLQADVVHEFGPRFAPGARVLYVGDTAKKNVVLDVEAFANLQVDVNEHDKLPDIVLFDENRQWLFLIEAVTSHGPVNPKRYAEMEAMFRKCPADRIYVTAFPSRDSFRKYAADIAWETEVWIADNPSHMIHFNGPKFLGPYSAP